MKVGNVRLDGQTTDRCAVAVPLASAFHTFKLVNRSPLMAGLLYSKHQKEPFCYCNHPGNVISANAQKAEEGFGRLHTRDRSIRGFAHRIDIRCTTMVVSCTSTVTAACGHLV